MWCVVIIIIIVSVISHCIVGTVFRRQKSKVDPCTERVKLIIIIVDPYQSYLNEAELAS